MLALALVLLAGPLAEGDVRGLVDRWLAAQNGGDLAAYDALYAQKFQGVRRSGPRTARLDRKRWMADRARMFKRPMKVAASELAVVMVGGAARVRFVQRWSSASYEDVGTKELFVVREGDAPRIAREEMLVSKVARAAAHGDLPFQIVETLGETTLVVRIAEAKDEWVKGRPRLVDRKLHQAVRTEVHDGKLPPAVKLWIGKTVELRGASGGVCTGKVRQLGVFAEAIPHFGTQDEWRGGDGRKPATADKIAADLWELAGERRFLGGELDLSGATCKGPQIALDPTQPAPPLVAFQVAQPSKDALARRAVQAFRSLPRHAEIQKAWLDAGATSDDRRKIWDGEPVVSVASLSGETIIVVSASVGNGCGDYSERISALLRVRGEGRPELLGLEQDHVVEPAFWIDAPGARGVVFKADDVLNERGIWDGKTLRVLSSVPFFDCPC